MAASVVIIEELNGRKRSIELHGSALPLQGATWGGLNLLSTRFNPGNPEGVQQVLGPQEVPSDWDFEWRTVRLIRTPVKVTDKQSSSEDSPFGEYSIARAIGVALLLEEIWRGCVLLRVTWINSMRPEEESSRITRIGRCSNWSYRYQRSDDITATISFEWIGRGTDQSKVSDIRGENLIASIQEATRASQRASAAAFRAILEDPDRNQQPKASAFTLGDLELLADGPRELIDSFARAAIAIENRLKQLGDLILKVKETPAAIAGRLVDVANNGVSVANQFIDAMSREGPETISTRNKVGVLAQNASLVSNAQTQAEFMAQVMEKAAEVARRRQSSLVSAAGDSRRQDQARIDDAFQVHVPRQGDTMMSIARRYYGTADLGDELSVANGLPGYTITPPRIPLIIPTRRALEEATRNRV